MQGTLEVWDGKIRRLDGKIIGLQDIASILETSGDSIKKEFKTSMKQINDMFLIPGVIGPDPTDLYENIGEFVKSIH